VTYVASAVLLESGSLAQAPRYAAGATLCQRALDARSAELSQCVTRDGATTAVRRQACALPISEDSNPPRLLP